MTEKERSKLLRWTKWGLYAGLMLGWIGINVDVHPVIGFYTGSVVLVFAVFGSIGAAAGAIAAWLDIVAPPDDPPPGD